jgi:hypothetical protein
MSGLFIIPAALAVLAVIIFIVLWVFNNHNKWAFFRRKNVPDTFKGVMGGKK